MRSCRSAELPPNRRLRNTRAHRGCVRTQNWAPLEQTAREFHHQGRVCTGCWLRGGLSTYMSAARMEGQQKRQRCGTLSKNLMACMCSLKRLIELPDATRELGCVRSISRSDCVKNLGNPPRTECTVRTSPRASQRGARKVTRTPGPHSASCATAGWRRCAFHPSATAPPAELAQK